MKSRSELQPARARDTVRGLGPISVLALMLAACSVTTNPSQEPDALPGSGYSMLDEAGLKQAARLDFSQITYFLTANSPEDLFGLIREGVDDYGIDGEVAERWIASASSDHHDGTSDYALDPGDKLGVDVVYDLRYDSTKPIQVIIVSVDLMAEPPGQVG